MAPRPRRLRNLNLDQVEDQEAVEDEQDNLAHKDTEESLQGSVFAGRDNIMASRPRRSRNLNLDHEEDREPAEDGHDNLQENDNEETLQGPLNVDRLLAHIPRNHPRSPIKIIWPNGNKREVLGDFTLSNLLALEGGKEKFAFPPPMRYLTRDWILKTVNNRWRVYKSKWKKQHFNRDERSLEEIIKGKPQTVNEYQWRSLAGFWCGEPHKKLSATNSRCAKQQKNTYTTGRKSHARLKREMEQSEKRKILRLELWEAAHKKKDGTYTSDKVDSVMDASCAELQRRQEINNGNLSAKDFNEVFNDIVAKELKVCGYYDNKFWSEVRASQGVTFVTPSEDDRSFQKRLIINEIEATVDDDDDDEDNGMEINTDNKHDHLRGNNVDSPTNYEQEVHIQSPTHGNKRDAATDFEGDPIQTNMSEMEVYLFSLRFKSRVVAKGHLVTSDSRRIIGETKLGSEFVAVHVDSIENVATGNKGDEEIPRPLYNINTLLGAVGYVIAWPRSHVKEVTSSSHT